MNRLAERALAAIDPLVDHEIHGSVTKVLGLLVEITGFGNHLSIGSVVHLRPDDQTDIPCEVVGFKEQNALLMPFGTLEGVGLGCKAIIQKHAPFICPDDKWLGRVINGLAQPIDGKGPLPKGGHNIPLKNRAPAPHARQRIGGKLDLGIRAVNTFLSTCQGQRMGIFSGSGVGKSVLLSMMARYTEADVSVIGLVGERGREVQEFLEDDLGEAGLARSVVVVATGDEPALMRRQAAYVTLATAEYFRAQGKQVLCLIDSVTRFAMAQREIGLSAGEPPTSKGYPPTTFGELARLLERAGPGVQGEGSITGLFSVLVEGDDHNEPISDAVRGIVDGHIVMDRAIADRGRYPAIDVLKSISRSMPGCLNEQQNAIITKSKQLISRYEDMAELIRLGAYRKGSDPEVDEAIALYPKFEEFLRQDKEEATSIDAAFKILGDIVGMPYGDDDVPSDQNPRRRMPQRGEIRTADGKEIRRG
ncbi:MAG: flagellar protein export ATPase FliI [Pseudomonadota bacterium]